MWPKDQLSENTWNHESCATMHLIFFQRIIESKSANRRSRPKLESSRLPTGYHKIGVNFGNVALNGYKEDGWRGWILSQKEFILDRVKFALLLFILKLGFW